MKQLYRKFERKLYGPGNIETNFLGLPKEYIIKISTYYKSHVGIAMFPEILRNLFLKMVIVQCLNYRRLLIVSKF